MADIDEAAQAMLAALNEKGQLLQETAVALLRKRFGKAFLYFNENGNEAIDRKLLKAFRKLTGDSVIWERSELCWRKRKSYDRPGRSQD